MRLHSLSILLLLLLPVLTSCNDKSKHQSKTYRVGVSQCSSGYWRDKLNNEMQRELLLHENVEMELLCADDNDERQINDIRHFIDEGVDALIVAPNSEEPLAGILAEAYDKGIPVILFDRYVKGDKYTTYVGGDNVGVGNTLATFVCSTAPSGNTVNVIEIMGNMNTSPARQRHEGFLETISSHKNINLLTSVDARWDGPRTKEVIDSLFKIYPKVDYIVAHSDYMAGSAKEEVEIIRPEAKIKYIGADGFGSPGLGVFAVAEGNIDATAMYPTAGDSIMRAAIDVINGKKLKKQNFLKSHIISDKREAENLIQLNNELVNEVKTIMVLRDKIQFYNDRLELERTLMTFMIAFLVVLILLIATLLWFYRVKQRANKRLYKQQQILTEQHAQLLQMTKELEAATNAKLLFFTNISHDFRTPLTLISAPIENAINKMSQISKQQTEIAGDILGLLKIANRNVQVLLDLVNQILDFRKIENGKMELHLAPHNLLSSIQGWHESFSNLAQQKNISIELHVEDDDWNVVCDFKRIERMVFNLFGNSLKFTPEGGIIQLSLYREDGNVCISVNDNGIGIPNEKLEHIFERFYQIEQSTHEGTGIGLALVKKLVELMNGRILISSNSDSSNGNHGTSITLVLPLAKGEEPVSGEQISDNKQKTVPELLVPPHYDIANGGNDDNDNKPIVLVVDDNDDIRSYLTSLLIDSYRVVTATDGASGLKLAREEVPDIIICDVMMPVMNGLDCCHYLKTDISTSHIPVLMLTACSLDEQRIKGLEEGAEAYISKPFSSAVLMAQLESLLKNRVIVKNFYSSTPIAKKPEMRPCSQNDKQDNVAPKTKLSRYDAMFVEKLQSTLEANLHDENFNVEVLADIMCLSRAQLYRKCKALVGESPVEVVRNTRIVKANKLLNTSSMSIAEVAKTVGFTDASYFTKCYKMYYGVLPSESGSAAK